MDASQYKDYVLTILFVKYVTDRYKNDPYADFVVPEGGSFDELVEAKGKSDIGERINKVLARLAEENDLKGVIDHVDFDDSPKLGSEKEKVDRLTKLIAIFENPELNFSKNRADGDDILILGDVYEYFMKKFATLKTFDFVVANPPFSQKNWMNGVNVENDPYRRFEDGIPHAKNGDYAFLLHLIKSLKPKGKGQLSFPTEFFSEEVQKRK